MARSEGAESDFASSPASADGIRRRLPFSGAMAGSAIGRSEDSPAGLDFVNGILGQRDTDRVADTVEQEGADSDRALDTPIESGSRLRHAKVNRVVHFLGGHLPDEQAVGGHHHRRDRGLQREDDLPILERFADTDELERRLDHSLRSVAVAVQNPVAQRAVVRSDPQGAAVCLQARDERNQPLPDSLDLTRVLGVRVLPNREPLAVGVVSRVDPDLLHIVRRYERGRWREVDVGHERNSEAPASQPILDSGEVLGGLQVRDGEADQGAAGGSESGDFVHDHRGVEGVRNRHRLNQNRMVSPDREITDPNHPARPAWALAQEPLLAVEADGSWENSIPGSIGPGWDPDRGPSLRESRAGRMGWNRRGGGRPGHGRRDWSPSGTGWEPARGAKKHPRPGARGGSHQGGSGGNSSWFNRGSEGPRTYMRQILAPSESQPEKSSQRPC